MKILVGNIQRMCVNDGPGIRTTVFLKGCALNCPWCANPENKKCEIQYYYDEDKCLKNDCPMYLKCSSKDKKFTSDDEQKCLVGAISHYGNYMDENDILNIILKDKNYYNNNGGVTFSGGDPLLFSENIVSLIKEIKKNNISVCVESSLFVPQKNIINIIDDIDIFIIDIKILVKDECKKHLNNNIDIYFENLDYIYKHNKNIIFRIPLVEPFTYNSDNIEKIIYLLKKYNPIKVELFKIHNLAKKKYQTLGLMYDDFQKIEDEKIIGLKKKIESINIETNIINF